MTMLPPRRYLRRSLRFSQSSAAQRLVRTRYNPRLFTQNSQLLLASTIKPRPQLPFLHPGTRGLPVQYINRVQLPSQLARFLTTERKQYIKNTIKLSAKFTVIGWVFLGLISLVGFGLETEVLDRQHPPPPEWTTRTKYIYRAAKSREKPNEQTGLVEWYYVGDTYRQLIERLEDPTIDGAGIQPILKDEGDIYIEGVGKAGLDVSAKSEPWRRGYHQCLMDLAKAAENRDGWVSDTKQKTIFPPHLVVGPSYPDPQPMPPGEAQAPLEENCVPMFDPPATYYVKILTTNGFTSRQRLDAALACADWLDFKGLPSTAEDMYDWALDIAMGALPVGVNNVVDIKTGVINSEADYISSNVLFAATALASHHARNNNLANALPIFLSILRARRQLPEPLPAPATIEKGAGAWSDIISFAKSALAARPFPPAPPTGNEVPTRTLAATCEEAGIMCNIGEILFASSTSKPFRESASESPVGKPILPNGTTGTQQSGLSWTREAVDLAEASLMAAKKDDEEARNKCTECLATSMENWSTMVERMLRGEREAKALPETQAQSRWFWVHEAAKDEERWERESRVVDKRLSNVRKLLLREEEQRKQEKGVLATLLGS